MTSAGKHASPAGVFVCFLRKLFHRPGEIRRAVFSWEIGMAMTGMQQAAHLGHPGVVGGGNNTLNTPRQRGFVECALGLANGLEGLERQLEALLARIDGNAGQDGIKAASTTPVGMSSCLSDAESHLRTCLSLIDELHNRF